MKIETQVLQLEKLMQTCHYDEYEVCFYPFYLKKSAFKKLSINEVLLLDVSSLEVQLLSKYNGCAKAKLLFNHEKIGIQIIEPIETVTEIHQAKKYLPIKIVWGKVFTQILKKEYRIENIQLHQEDVLLYYKECLFARGRLVSIADKIAIEIKEVKK